MARSIDVIGVDGSVWQLLNPQSGVTLSGGVSGLHLPPVTPQWAATARIAGHRRRGQSGSGRQAQMRAAPDLARSATRQTLCST